MLKGDGQKIMDISKISGYIKNEFLQAPKSHDWDHIQRVYQLCIRIGKKENADMQVVKLAALLHDIGRKEQDASKGHLCHAQIGAIKAQNILFRYHIAPEIIDQVVYCIKTHRFRRGEKPTSLEAKVLFDADKLDSIGAIGIGRAFFFAGEIGAKVHNKEIDLDNSQPYTEEDTAYREFMVKLQKIKSLMLTEEGKKIAAGRHTFMVNFFERLKQEVEGLC